MISNHYPLIFGTRYNWVIAAIVLALGPVIRHFFNERHAGRKSPWWVWGVAAIGMIAIAFLTTAGPRDAKAATVVPKHDFAAVQDIVLSRCSMCHAAEPVFDGITAAPKGVRLDDPDQIMRNSRLIGRNAAWSNAMPPGNITEITPQERAVLAAWLADPTR
jgi:uncharacterized membrane protein